MGEYIDLQGIPSLMKAQCDIFAGGKGYKRVQ